MGPGQSEGGLGLVDVSTRFDGGMVLRHPPAEELSGGAVVAAAGVDPQRDERSAGASTGSGGLAARRGRSTR